VLAEGNALSSPARMENSAAPATPVGRVEPRTASFLRERVHQFRADILVVVVLAALAGLASYEGQRLVGSFIALGPNSWNVWFEDDSPRVFDNMVVGRTGGHYRTDVHPLFSLAAYAPTYVLRKVAGMDNIHAVRIVFAGIAAAWLGVLFILLRLIGCHRFDATLFSVLGATSAVAVFWFTVPETYSFGSLSILLGLSVIALAEYRNLSSGWFLVCNALTLSMTKTNWMVGLFGTFAHYSWKRAFRIAVSALCLVVVLWGVERLLFPTANFFIGGEEKEATKYVFLRTSGGPLKVFSSFIFHSMIMPAIRVVVKPEKQPWPTMSTQMSLPGSGSLWGAAGVVIWAALLAFGIWALFGMKRHSRFGIVLGLTILGQLGLHLLYGDETFLYGLHFGPLLVVLAALTTLTRARYLALVLAGALTLVAGVNNGLEFRRALQFVRSRAPAELKVPLFLVQSRE
jgi:hypothetical protein